MLDRKELLALAFYAKSDFYGSIGNMNYRISCPEKDVKPKIPITHFDVCYWPGPFNYAKTDEKLKQTAEFPFSEEGICALADFLNEQYVKQAELWNVKY